MKLQKDKVSVVDVVGKTVVANSASDLEGVDLSESVIVTNSVDETLVPYIEQAVGLITEENGITSPSAIIGLEKVFQPL